MAVMTERPADDTAIRPFTIEIPEADLEDLRARIAATRWPEKEGVEDASQGVQLATIQAVARYWETEYDWRKCEARLNSVPQFVTEIDGLDIHFVHVRSKHEDALPLIVCHGWPGSFIEQMKIVDLLTDPTAHGGSASDAFHVVIPNMPGYGFSGKPTEAGLGPDPHRARLGRADEAPRLRAVRGGGRRLWRARHRVHGRRPRRPRVPGAGAAGAAGVPHQLPRRVPARRRPGDPDRWRAAVRSLSRRATRDRAARVRVQARGVRRAAGDAPADDVRAQRLPGRPGGLPCSTTTRRATS